MLVDMPHRFISKGISSKIVTMDNNTSERKGYYTTLTENNDEYDLYHDIECASNNNSGILSGYI